ncbi:GNAT family N-acetyltransferase [Cereibacter changlensis]|uniref:GNAT family N-acetyltransferase n=1 Tax=Cereibacter changlensis TaxID=402884 RepID=A0A4U0YTI9_9RHOB|nr:GNAT family N-acetyltransferase [Cereibacter changlensis]TKA95980.1 GNAT family N-acetyltransferase [Cereibacter changlensis]
MLRRAETAELAAIAALIARHPMQLLAMGEDWLAEIAADPANRVMVWDRGGFAGFAIIETAYPQVLTLPNLAVTKAGEGRALIAGVLELAFAEMGAHRLFLDTVFDNPRALEAFRRAGFTEEGRFRQCWLRPDGLWADCIGMAILRDEWARKRSEDAAALAP